MACSAAWHHVRWLGFWSTIGPSCAGAIATSWQRCRLPRLRRSGSKAAAGWCRLINETFLRLHDRYAEQPGSYELVPGDPMALLQQFATVTERYPGGETRTLVPLTRLVIELVAWARAAPEIKPGRK